MNLSLDYKGQEAQLETSDNIFSNVILSHLAAQQFKKKPHQLRKKTKITLTKRLYSRGYNKEQVQKLYLFIDWLLHLPTEDELEYQEEIYKLEQNMAYISTIERMGIEKGVHQGACGLLLHLLTSKFKSVPTHYQKRLLQATAGELKIFSERLFSARSLEEVFFVELA